MSQIYVMQINLKKTQSKIINGIHETNFSGECILMHHQQMRTAVYRISLFTVFICIRVRQINLLFQY